MHKIIGADFLKIQNRCWLSSVERNGLYEYNFLTREMSFIGFFPNEEIWVKNLHSRVLRWEDKLAFIPAVANNLHMYDIKTGEIVSYALPGRFHKKLHKFNNAVIYDKKIFLIGYQESCILIFDIQSKQYRQLSDIDIVSLEGREYFQYFDRDAVIKGNDLFLTTRHNGYIYKVDMSTECVDKWLIGDKEGGYALTCYDDQNFWSVDNLKRKLICWNERDGVKEEIFIPEKLCDIGNYWIESIYCSDILWFVRTEDIVLFNMLDQTFYRLSSNRISEMFNTSMRNLTNLGLNKKIYCTKKIDNYIFFLTYAGNIYKLDKNQDVIDMWELEDEHWRIEEKEIMYNEVAMESKITEWHSERLNLFLDCIKPIQNTICKKSSVYGEKIYAELVKDK